MSWLKEPPEEMTPEEAKKFRKSQKKKALFVLFFVLGMFFIIFIIFWLNNPTKAPTDSDVYNLPQGATIGKYYEYDFSPINVLLDSVNSKPYIYYFGSEVEFQPTGLSLDPSSGVLGGTPKVAGTSNFEVCVKDTAGKSACMKFSLEVTSAVTTKKKVSVPAKNNTVIDNTCESFAVSSCGNIGTGGGSVGAFPVFNYCGCPSGTYFDGHTEPIPKEHWGELPAGYHGDYTFKFCSCDGQ